MTHQEMARSTEMKTEIGEQEWKARIELAACYRLMARYGYTDLIYNHITLKVPGTQNHFLINPYGRFYSEVTASSLHTIDLDGEIIRRGDPEFGINKAGYVIHSAVHAAREDAHCVIHTHTRWDVAIATMKCGLLPISQGALRFVNRIGYHPFEGPAIDEGERARLQEHLGSNDVLLLHNHGSLVCGRSVAEAFFLTQRFQVACQIQVELMSTGAEIIYPGKEAQERTTKLFDPKAGSKDVAVGGGLEWQALVRSLDAQDPGYKQ
jgi:ribulose-5-phosphate 4-epimerase/fuculose-1-phosphate aldolase